MTADRRDMIERDIVLCRGIDAPIERLLTAWTDPKQITQWFGPRGFHLRHV